MKGLHAMRRAVRRSFTSHQGIAPQQVFVVTQQRSYNDILKLPQAVVTTPVQNPDGSFPYMVGYDGLGEAPLA